MRALRFGWPALLMGLVVAAAAMGRAQTTTGTPPPPLPLSPSFTTGTTTGFTTGSTPGATTGATPGFTTGATPSTTTGVTGFTTGTTTGATGFTTGATPSTTTGATGFTTGATPSTTTGATDFTTGTTGTTTGETETPAIGTTPVLFVGPLASPTAQGPIGDRASYQGAVGVAFDRTEADLADLRERALDLDASVRSQVEPLLDSLDARLDEARGQLDSLADVTNDTWATFKPDMDRTVATLLQQVAALDSQLVSLGIE